MKTSIFIIVLLLGLSCGLATADPTIMISDYTLTPEVLFPGDTAQLVITLANGETTHTITSTSTTGGTTTVRTDTVAATIDKVRFIADGDGTKEVRASESFSSIGDIAPGTSLDLTFKILAENNITSDWYFPAISVDVESYEDVRYPIPIKISDASVDLLLTEVPSKISIGGETSVTLTVVNTRENQVDGVIIQHTDQDELLVSPSSIAVGSLASDASQAVMFALKPQQTGVFNVSFDIIFKNGENQHIQTISFPLEVIETLDVAPVFYGNTPYVPVGGSSRIRLEVFNAKTSEISGVIVTPITDAEVSPSQYFIGSMDPDDVFSVSFDVYPGSLSVGNYSMGFVVSFKQGEDYYETPMAYKEFQVIPRQEQPSEAGSGVFIGAFIIIVLAVIVLLYFFKLRRRRL